MATPADRGPNPTIPVVPGDRGPAVWEETRAILDAAVKKAYGAARSVDWLEMPAGKDALADGPLLAPEATLAAFRTYGLGLVGVLETAGDGVAPAHEQLRRGLDLFADETFVPVGKAGISCWIAALESEAGPLELAPGAPETERFLKELSKKSPGIHGRMRFGSQARVLSYERARGSRETPPLETAVGVVALSQPGVERLVFHAMSGVARQKRKKLTCVYGGDASLVEQTMRDGFFDHLEGRWELSVITERNHLRHALRAPGGMADADAWAAPLFAQGWVFADALSIEDALEHVVRTPDRFDAVVASTEVGWLLVEALRAKHGITTPVVRTSAGTSGTRLFSPGPFASGDVREFVACGAALLKALGWNEAVAALPG